MESSFDVEAWASAYVAVHEARAHLDENHPDFLAGYHFLGDLTGPLAEECWQGILAVVRRRPSDWVLGMLAAGPLEDLLIRSGSEFIERVEVEARQSSDFRLMLHGAWESGTPEIWARVEIARGAPENAT